MTDSPHKALRVFLSHCSEDKPRIRSFYQYLTNAGFDIWLDEKNLLPGQDWNLEIDKAIRSADAVIVVLSKRMVSKEGYIQKELKHVLAVDEEKPQGAIFIIPVLLEECEIPEKLRRLQYVTISQRENWGKIISALNQRVLALESKQLLAANSSSILARLPRPPSISENPVEPIQFKNKKDWRGHKLNFFGIRFIGAVASVPAALTLRLISDDYYSSTDSSILSFIAEIVANSDLVFVFLVLASVAGAIWAVHKIDRNLEEDDLAIWLRYLLSLFAGYAAGLIADILLIFVIPLFIAIGMGILSWIAQSGGNSGSTSQSSSPRISPNPNDDLPKAPAVNSNENEYLPNRRSSYSPRNNFDVGMDIVNRRVINRDLLSDSLDSDNLRMIRRNWNLKSWEDKKDEDKAK